MREMVGLLFIRRFESMWIYVVTSFTRYNKVGRKAKDTFQKALVKDGFFQLHENLYVRYCGTVGNANMHKERVKKVIPIKCCDVSIIMSADSQESNIYHSLNRKRSKCIVYGKYGNVEFF